MTARPTCGTCDWYLPDRAGRGACGFAPPVAVVVGALDHLGGGVVDGMLRAETIRPIVGATTPCCARHQDAAAWRGGRRT